MSSPFLVHQSQWSSSDASGASTDYVDYSDLLPLDGEEGELIDDEACYVDFRTVTGIGRLHLLPIPHSI